MKGPNLQVHGSIVKGKTGYETIVLGIMKDNKQNLLIIE
jgi:hypothetical protein